MVFVEFMGEGTFTRWKSKFFALKIWIFFFFVFLMRIFFGKHSEFIKVFFFLLDFTSNRIYEFFFQNEKQKTDRPINMIGGHRIETNRKKNCPHCTCANRILGFRMWMKQIQEFFFNSLILYFHFDFIFPSTIIITSWNFLGVCAFQKAKNKILSQKNIPQHQQFPFRKKESKFDKRKTLNQEEKKVSLKEYSIHNHHYLMSNNICHTIKEKKRRKFCTQKITNFFLSFIQLSWKLNPEEKEKLNWILILVSGPEILE